MEVCHVVLCRNKEDSVAMSVLSALNQDCENLHVVISDQCSTDNTLKIINHVVGEYKGPHKVSVLSCQETEFKGMSGMNAHLDWVVKNTTEKYIVFTSASDWAHPERTRKTVKLFKEFNPDMVLNAQQFIDVDGTVTGVTAHPDKDGFVSPRTCLEGCVGGSTAHSFTRDFLEACGPFKGVSGFDCYMPFLATCRNGAYFSKELLHAYVRDASLSNTGLEGVYNASDEIGKIQVEELMHFQVTSGLVKAAKILDLWGMEGHEGKQPLYEQIIGRAASWANTREVLTVKKIPPKELNA